MALTKVNYRVEVEVDQQLRSLAEKQETTVSKVIRLAIAQYLEGLKQNSPNQAA